jgi:hypothetical protein
MSLITISTASINYTSGTTDCQCSIETVVLSVGLTYVGTSVSLQSSDLPPDWTDEQLCVAVAASLGVPVEDVSVAVYTPPAPPEPIPEPTPEPVVTPEPTPVEGV